jgi:hypothetical protein
MCVDRKAAVDKATAAGQQDAQALAAETLDRAPGEEGAPAPGEEQQGDGVAAGTRAGKRRRGG